MGKRYLLDIERGSACGASEKGRAGCALSKVTTNAFRAKLIRVADAIGVDPSALAAVIMHETAGTASPSIQNPYTRATGLIQFMPSTARALGTSVEALKEMSAIEQLDWVQAFFRPHAGKSYLRDPGNVYAAVFCPALLSKSMDTVVGRPNDSSPSPCGSTMHKVWEQNRFSSGAFTKSTVVGWVEASLRAAEARPRIEVAMESWFGYLVPALLGAAASFGTAWGLREISR